MWNKINERLVKHGKFESVWLGPYQIEYVSSKNSFYLIHLNGHKLPLPIDEKSLKIFYLGEI